MSESDFSASKFLAFSSLKGYLKDRVSEQNSLILAARRFSSWVTREVTGNSMDAR